MATSHRQFKKLSHGSIPPGMAKMKICRKLIINVFDIYNLHTFLVAISVGYSFNGYESNLKMTTLLFSWLLFHDNILHHCCLMQ